MTGAQKQGQAYYNFINSLNSPATKRQFSFRLEEFLTFIKLDLNKFLKLPQDRMTNIIIKYLVEKKVSASSKHVIYFAIKHALEVNDILLNWKKIKKFVKSEKTGNEIVGKDRGYTTAEIQQILTYSDQRLRMVFLLLCSSGSRIGGLLSLKVGDLQRMKDLYAVTMYAGDKEQYLTFCTPECAKEIDNYLDSRKRKGENITSDSYLIVKRYSASTPIGKPFVGDSLRVLLAEYINKSGIRQVSNNQYKRREVPLLHGFRKWFTKQLIDSKVNSEIREMLLGHDIGLAGRYYRPTQQDMLNEFFKAVSLLTISNEERLKFRLEERITIERTQMQKMQAQIDELISMRKKKKK